MLNEKYNVIVNDKITGEVLQWNNLDFDKAVSVMKDWPLPEYSVDVIPVKK
jgi:hypothetical protein